jgi:leucyl-tRNA synthetase
MCYKEGFYNGKMILGHYAGLPVQEAKPKIKSELVEASLAAIYYEPEGEVVSRSGDACVVCLMDQWYLDYGEEEWRQKAEK